MNKSENFAILNIAGSVCSIVALLITLSGNFTLRNIVQIIFAVAAIVGVAGIVFGVAKFWWKKYIHVDYWSVKLLYWLVVIIIVALLSGIAGIGIYCIVDFLLVLGKSALKLAF